MHPKEAYHQKTGTGRLAHIALQNSEIIVGLDFSENKRVNEILTEKGNRSFLLYPDKRSVNVSEPEAHHQFLGSEKITVFLIDSTWSCSNKVLRLSSNLRRLPTLAFNIEETSKFDIKKQPKSFCLSTIEAIYYLLEEFEKLAVEEVGEKKEILLSTLKKMVEFQLECKEKYGKKKGVMELSS